MDDPNRVPQQTWRKPTYRQTVAFFTAVGVATIVFGLLPFTFFGFDEEAAAAFGTSFGFVSALVSGLAFAGVILTLWMQSQELQLQRDELRQTREQHEKIAEAQIDSEKRLFLTAFLNSVTTLIDLGSPSQYELNYTTESDVIRHEIARVRYRSLLAAILPAIQSELAKLYPDLKPSDQRSLVWILETHWKAIEIIDEYFASCRADNHEHQITKAVEVGRAACQYIFGIMPHLRGHSDWQKIIAEVRSVLDRAPVFCGTKETSQSAEAVAEYANEVRTRLSRLRRIMLNSIVDELKA